MKRIIPALMLGLLVTSQVNAEALTVAVPEDAYPPYVIHDNQGEAINGLLIEPLRAALNELGVDLVLQELPILRSRPMLEAGQLDGRMESSYWAPDSRRYLWLDVGVWLQDVLLYRNDLSFEPLSLAAVHGSEVITHLGYRYPSLDPLFDAGFITRIDRSDETAMIDALMHAPGDSERLLVIDRGVWDWYAARTDIPIHLRIEQSPVIVGCAPLQIQLADTPRLRELQPRIQAILNRHKGPDSTACVSAISDTQRP